MYLKYGSYQFTNNVISYDRGLNVQRSQTGTPAIVREKWVIRGRIRGTSSSDISSKCVTLVNQMIDGYDLVFIDNQGNVTSDAMLNANQLNGCQCDGVRWLPNGGDPRESGAEFVNMRSYEIIINGQRRAGAIGDVLMWDEHVSVIGTGGPRFVMVPAIVGTPLPVQTQLYSSVVVIQQGRAVGLTDFPAFPAPLYSGIEHVEMRVQDKGTPQAWGITNNKNLQFPTMWKYTFEAMPGVITSVPNPTLYH